MRTKEEHLWGLSSFFVGEERVTTQFSGLVMAYEDEQEEAFLTTQQVDEARHMQFFDRWFREVAGIDGGHPRAARGLARGRDGRVRRAVRRAAREDGRAPDRRPERHGREGRLHHHLPHGHRGNARAHRPALHARLLREERPASRASPRASGTSPATSTGTWPTAPGSSSRSAPRSATASACRQTLNDLLPLAAGVLVPKGYAARRRVRVLRLHLAGAGRVRLQRAVAAAEGDRGAACATPSAA